jgi:glucosylglycerate synthase
MPSTGLSSSVAPSEATPAKADLVVGLTSYNDAETIGRVTAAVRAGLTRHFDGVASRIVLADAGSADDTTARARAALEGADELIVIAHDRATADLLQPPYHGIPGRARALRSILTVARDLNARACVAVDAGLVTIAPHWVESLAGPVIQQGFDFVSPHYRRQPHEGALTKGLVYPMFRALYGLRIHQPAAGEFACSSRLLARFLEEEFWDSDGAQFGIDLWLTGTAASGDFRVSEAALGVRTHSARGEDALDLGTTVTQVIGSLFADMDGRVETWQRVRGSSAVQRFGEPDPAPLPDQSSVDLDRLIDSFRLGYRELRDIWTWILPPKTILDLKRLIDAAPAHFRLDDELWARIVYDFALGYRLRVLARDHLLRSLVPLYLGWLASFVLQVRDLGADEADQRVEQLGLAFEVQKPYLIARWRWPERFRT